MRYAVIVPSRTASNLTRCLDAVWRHDSSGAIRIIDDGVAWNEIPAWSFLGGADGLDVIKGIKPFVYARNCNLGIKAWGGDVILLNDDALLETPRGFELLRRTSDAHPDYGIISAVTDVVGNPAQRPRGVGLREEPRTVAFVCVYIPRRTIDQVGLLDERFTSYGWEDNDYCRRIRNAGLKIGILDDCFLNHSSLKSTFRGSWRAAGDISAGRAIYLEKWGDTQ